MFVLHHRLIWNRTECARWLNERQIENELNALQSTHRHVSVVNTTSFDVFVVVLRRDANEPWNRCCCENEQIKNMRNDVDKNANVNVTVYLVANVECVATATLWCSQTKHLTSPPTDQRSRNKRQMKCVVLIFLCDRTSHGKISQSTKQLMNHRVNRRLLFIQWFSHFDVSLWFPLMPQSTFAVHEWMNFHFYYNNRVLNELSIDEHEHWNHNNKFSFPLIFRCFYSLQIWLCYCVRSWCLTANYHRFVYVNRLGCSTIMCFDRIKSLWKFAAKMTRQSNDRAMRLSANRNSKLNRNRT